MEKRELLSDPAKKGGGREGILEAMQTIKEEEGV